MLENQKHNNKAVKQVAVIGAGRMTKPLIDYFIDTCRYKVIVADIDIEQPEKVINGRELGTAIRWSTDEPETIDKIVKEADIVVSMVPKPIHIHIAKPCLRHNKNMITTSYEIPEMLALDKEARNKGVLFLNEIGEDPGIDHLGTQTILDKIEKEDGDLESLFTYGSGIPSFENNDNPIGYKFAWDPVTFFNAAQTSAAYYIKGERIEVPGDQLFKHFKQIQIEGLGTFETYPNKDCKKYLKQFGLNRNITFYRGLLRYPGYCNNMNNLSKLGLFESEEEIDFKGITYRQLLGSLVHASSDQSLERSVAEYLHLNDNTDFIHILRWLGFFEAKEIGIESGSRQNVLLDIMLKKLLYQPHEKDMIIVHVEATADFPGKGREKRIATMKVEGIPYGDSAMSRAVAFPAAIAAKLILEGKIKASGLQTPATLPSLYKPLLSELATFGYAFEERTQKL